MENEKQFPGFYNTTQEVSYGKVSAPFMSNSIPCLQSVLTLFCFCFSSNLPIKMYLCKFDS